MPVVVPLSLFSVFGILVFLDLERKFALIKKIATGVYLTVTILLLAVGIFAAPLLAFVFLLLFPLIGTAFLDKQGVHLYFFIHNVVLTAINVGTLTFTLGL